jgi:hypothetical protein
MGVDIRAARKFDGNIALKVAAIGTQQSVTCRYTLREKLRFELVEAVEKFLVLDLTTSERGF